MLAHIATPSKARIDPEAKQWWRRVWHPANTSLKFLADPTELTLTAPQNDFYNQLSLTGAEITVAETAIQRSGYVGKELEGPALGV